MTTKSKERSKNQQFAINLGATLVAFVVNFGIQFLLTPYIVKSLGSTAYGFIGLSTNILGYTSLITIALNSMAGRFVTIKYTEGKVDEANKYFSSIFYSNIVLASVILIFSLCCIIWLEHMVNIPKELVVDVKLLFFLLTINQIVGLVTQIWGVATFIKNRLDLSNIRAIIGNLIKAAIVVTLFVLCPPHIWYMGVAGVALTLYTSLMNKRFSHFLTPDLIIRKSDYEWEKVVELLKSGAWNVISKMGEILGSGLDLLIANLCIGAAAMGTFSLTKNVPFMILSLFQMISSVFAPVITQQYALGMRDDLLKELHKSIRILGFFSTIPLACLYVLGTEFYSLWLPTQDASFLQSLTIVSTIGLAFALPLEALWNIFTVTNKIKYSSLVTVLNNVIVFIIVMSSMFIVDSETVRLLILAGTRSFTSIIRVTFFLPMYGAWCLGEKKSIFYPDLIRSLAGMVLACSICFFLKAFVVINSWGTLILAGISITAICSTVNFFIVLRDSDRQFIRHKLLKL